MNTEKMNPRHRKQAATLAACMFDVMTEPTEWRMIVELHTIPEEYKNDPDPLRHYYMKLWERDDDFHMSDEYIGEMISTNDSEKLYYENGVEFEGSADELEEYSSLSDAD